MRRSKIYLDGWSDGIIRSQAEERLYQEGRRDGFNQTPSHDDEKLDHPVYEAGFMQGRLEKMQGGKTNEKATA